MDDNLRDVLSSQWKRELQRPIDFIEGFRRGRRSTETGQPGCRRCSRVCFAFRSRAFRKSRDRNTELVCSLRCGSLLLWPSSPTGTVGGTVRLARRWLTRVSHALDEEGNVSE